MSLSQQRINELRNKINGGSSGNHEDMMKRLRAAAGVETTSPTQVSKSFSESIEEEKEPGILKSIVQGISRPFAKVAAGVGALTEGGYNLLKGDVEGAHEAVTRERDFGLFGGKVRPVGINDEGERATTKEFVKNAIGTGLDLGTNLVGGTGVKQGANVVGRGLMSQGGKNVSKAFTKQAIKQGAKTGALTGGAGSLGISLQEEDNSLGKSIKEAAIGTMAGTGLGSIFGKLNARKIINAPKAAEKAREQAIARYSKFFAPTKEKQKENLERSADFLLDKKWWGTRKKVLEKIDNQIKVSGQEYSKLGELDGLASIDGILNKIDEKLNSYKLPTGKVNSSLESQFKTLSNAKDDLIAYTSYKEGISSPTVYSRKIKELADVYGDMIYNTRKSLKTADDNRILSQYKEVDSLIRSLLNKQYPNYAKINQVFSKAKNLEEVLYETIKRKAPQSGKLEGFAQLATTIITAGNVFAQNWGIAGSTAGLFGLYKLATSPMYLSFSAARKAKLMDRLLKMTPEQLTRSLRVISRFGIKGINDIINSD